MSPNRRGPLVVEAHGHALVRASHRKTLELTRDPSITQRGTCIVGVGASWDDAAAKRTRGRQRVTLEAGGHIATFDTTISATFVGGTSLVFRRGPDLAERTFGYATTLAASDLDRALAAALADPGASVRLSLAPVPGTDPAPGAVFVLTAPIGDDPHLDRAAARVLGGVDVVLAPDPRDLRGVAATSGVDLDDVRPAAPALEGPGLDDLVGQVAGGARLALVAEPDGLVLDPAGTELVRRARATGATVRPVAGPGAGAAVLASGIRADSVTVAGRLPRRPAARRARLVELGRAPGALVVDVDAPALAEILADLAAALPGRELAVVADLATAHERVVVARTDDPSDAAAAGPPRDRCTVVVGPVPVPDGGTGVPDDVLRLVANLADVPTRTLADAVARTTGVSRKDAYGRVLATRGRSGPATGAEPAPEAAPPSGPPAGAGR